MLRWVKLNAYTSTSGDTEEAVHTRVRRGIWLRDVHVRRPEGSKEVWVNLAAVNDWVEGKTPAHLHGKDAR